MKKEKIAILLRGHIRKSIDNNRLLNFVQSLNEHFDLDIFMHTWDETEATISWRKNLLIPEKTSKEKIENYFYHFCKNIKFFTIENDKKLDEKFKDCLGLNIGAMPKLAWKKMWHGVNEASKQIPNEYRCVVNTRFDIFDINGINNIAEKHKWNEENLKNLVIDFVQKNKQISFVNDYESIGIDNFYLSTPKIMKFICSNFYYNLDFCENMLQKHEIHHEVLVFRFAKFVNNMNISFI